MPKVVYAEVLSLVIMVSTGHRPRMMKSFFAHTCSFSVMTAMGTTTTTTSTAANMFVASEFLNRVKQLNTISWTNRALLSNLEGNETLLISETVRHSLS